MRRTRNSAQVAAGSLEPPVQVHHQPIAVGPEPQPLCSLSRDWKGRHHSKPTGDHAQRLAHGPQWVLQTRLERTHIPAFCFKGPSLEQRRGARMQEAHSEGEAHKGRHESAPWVPQEHRDPPHPGLTPNPFPSLSLAQGLGPGRRKD